MIVRVECEAGHRGEATPRRLWLDGRPVELVELQDAWLAPDYRYFKLRGADGATYILRHDQGSRLWQLTLYQALPGPPVSRSGPDDLDVTDVDARAAGRSPAPARGPKLTPGSGRPRPGARRRHRAS